MLRRLDFMPLSRRNFLTASLAAATAATASKWAFPQIASPRLHGDAQAQQHRPILLNSNENAYGTSPQILQEMRSALQQCNRYPYPAYDMLVSQIAAYHRVTAKQVLAGCGSTEVLRICANAFLGPGRALVIAQPTFEDMSDDARQIGAEVRPVPLNRSYQHDLDRMLTQADRSATL